MAQVAFIGTGLIGAALAEAAVRRGDEVTVWNRTASKAEALGALGMSVAPSLHEAVRGRQRVHLALSDDAAVDSVLDALLPSLDGALLIDHSTTSPRGTADRAVRLAARGVAFAHAPVFMSPRMCLQAGGVMLLSAPDEVRAQVAPALAQMTGRLHDVGARADLAAAYKLFGNAMILSVTAGLADVYTLARALDIPAPDAHSLFSVFNPAGGLAVRGLAMAHGDYTPSFELTMARKDARLMLEAASMVDLPLVLLPAIAARMDALLAAGHGAADVGVLACDAVPAKRSGT
jgi:3-hydroxyisobutyrate dehydrogenase-like beta-hydroxyacid dehydrogenase